MSAVEQFSHFDATHWAKVKAARAAQGLRRYTEDGKELADHPLVGRCLTDSETGRQYQVENVKKSWQQGWFIRAKLVRDDLVFYCAVENQSSVCPDVLRSHATFMEMFANGL